MKNPNIASSGKKKPGRPRGARTRADAPSRVNLAAKNGGIPPAPRPPRPSEQAKPVETVKTNETAPITVSPDTELFGNVKPPIRNPTGEMGESIIPDDSSVIADAGKAADSGQPDGGNHAGSVPDPDAVKDDKTPPKPDPEDAESQRSLVTIIVDTVLGAFAMIIGTFWNPRPIGNEPGQCPYDERERLIVSGCKWFASMAIAILTPGQEFAMECFNYALPRMKGTYEWLRTKFIKRQPKPANPTSKSDARMPGQPPENNKPPTDIKSEITLEPGTTGAPNP